MTRIAAIQMCSSHEVDHNLKIAEKLFIEAANHDAKLVVLPEMFPIFGLSDQQRILSKEKLGSGKVQDFLANQAIKLGIWIVAGTIPTADENPNKINATTLVYNDLGQVVGSYNKMHLFDVCISETEVHRESETIRHGEKPTVISSPFGKLGLAVCYDIRFPEMFRYLFNHGAEIFIVPAAFTIPTGRAHWHVLMRSRAIENLSYVIGAAQGGTHTNGRQTYGHSIAIDPWGKILAEASGIGETVLYADIDLQYLHKVRKSIPIASHQRFKITLV